MLSLRKLRDEGTVKILKFDDPLLKAFLAISKDVVAEIGSDDELSKKIYQSYMQFRASIMDWSDIAERAFLNARGLGAVGMRGTSRPPPSSVHESFPHTAPTSCPNASSNTR